MIFTEDQLTLLMDLQSDDWHPYYFKGLVQKSGEKKLTEYINRLRIDQIQDLQLALDLLASLPAFDCKGETL